MNKFIIFILAFFAINGFFSLISFLFPTMPIDKILPIQLWINALLLFMLILPGTVATFLYSMVDE